MNGLKTYEDIVLPLAAVIEAIGTKGASPGTAAMGQRQAIMHGRQSEIDRVRQEKIDEQDRQERALRRKLTGMNIAEAEAGQLERTEARAKREALEKRIGNYETEWQAAQTPEEKIQVNLKYIESPVAQKRLEYDLKSSKGDDWLQKLLLQEQFRSANKKTAQSQKQTEDVKNNIESNKQNSPEYEVTLGVLNDIETSTSSLKRASGSKFGRGKSLNTIQEKGFPTFGMINESDQAYLNNITRVKNMLAVENRSKLKGQGQVSDFEGRLLSNAATIIDTGTAHQRTAEVRRLKRMYTALKHRADNNIVFKNGKWQQLQEDGSLIPVSPLEALDLSTKWEIQ